jgi:hypothetical protein
MVDQEKDLRELIFSALYQERLDELCTRSGVSIYSQYNDVIFKFDKNRFELSALDLTDVTKLLTDEWVRFSEFCVSKIELFRAREMKQDFPKGEEVEKFDQKEKLLGFSRGILIMYAIEFLLGIKGKDFLGDYVKKSRIPGAKQYVSEVMSLLK